MKQIALTLIIVGDKFKLLEVKKNRINHANKSDWKTNNCKGNKCME